METLVGPSNNILEVDLSSQKTTIYRVTQEERKLYLGGKGLGLKLLFDRLETGIDPLGEKNIIAFMPGVLMGTSAPCSGRFEAITKSPLTGIMAASSCGGPFGLQLKTAGWDGLLVKGKSARPICLEITAQGVKFKDASEYWGQDAHTAQAHLAGKKAGALVIGPAGENIVRFANIVSGHRYLGRGGMGAVLGSKNVKAIVAKGGAFQINPQKVRKFNRTKKTAMAFIKQNPVTSGSYRDFGTASTVHLSNAGGILPINNFTLGESDQAYKVAGETFAKEHQSKHHTCKPCAIRCGHKGAFQSTTKPIPEYESIVLIGTNLGIFDRELIAEWNEICNQMGLDTISTGGTLAWVMEATEKGLIESNLHFGSPEGVAEAIYDIAHSRGLGKELGLGSRALSQKYGGEAFAMQTKGLELAAYDPRGSVGLGLAYAVANRGGCHLSSYVVSLEVFFGLLNPYTPRAKPEFTIFFENLNNCINSLETCLFTLFAYTMEDALTKMTPDPILGLMMQYLPNIATKLINFSLYTEFWSALTGIYISNSDFIKAGNRIHTLERYMNTREGISRKDDTLPLRLLTEGRQNDPKKRAVPLSKMLDKYYKLRGYDTNGVPTPNTLRRLSITK